MKKLGLIALIALFANVAQASFMATTCSTANGRISHSFGHINETTLRILDWQSGEEIIEDANYSQMTTLEAPTVISEEHGSNECVGQVTKIYVVKATLQLPKSASNEAKELVEGPKVFLCEYHANWAAPCPDIRD